MLVLGLLQLSVLPRMLPSMLFRERPTYQTRLRAWLTAALSRCSSTYPFGALALLRLFQGMLNHATAFILRILATLQ